MNNYRSGKWAEFLARLYLRLHGYRIVARNIIVGRGTTAGEIDIIACKHKCLVFVEVKYRANDKTGHPLEAVDIKKQIKISKAAVAYLKMSKMFIQEHASNLKKSTLIIKYFINRTHWKN